MEIEGLKLVHALPGRVRLRVARVKGNPSLAQRAQKRLANVPGVIQVEAKPVTGSLLIRYDPLQLTFPESWETLSATLAQLFPEMGEISLWTWITSLTDQPGPSPDANPAGSIADFFTGKAAGSLDLKLLVPLTLFLFGARALWLAEKATFPAWYDYFWFAFSTFYMLNRGLNEEPR